MVEQVQTSPPYDVLTTLAVAPPPADAKASTGIASSHSTLSPKQVDVVTLSDSAQANQLYLQGNSVTQIAAQLGLPPATVESDLNISAVNSIVAQTIQPTTAQSPAGQIAPADASTPFSAVSSPFKIPAAMTEKIP